MSPTLLALNAALLFALGAQFISLGLRDMDARTGSTVTMLSSAGLYWILAPWFIESWYFFTTAALIFAGIGLFRPLLSSNLGNFGNHYLGPTRSTTLASTTPFFSVAMGAAFLGESLSWQVIAGTALIVIGVMVLGSKRGRGPESFPIWALALPIGAAFFRALAHVLTKVGLLTLGSAFFAALMSYSVSTTIAVGSEAFRKRNPNTKFSRRASVWFILAGICNGIAIMNLNYALLFGRVMDVIPIVSCSPFFTLVLSVAVFRREKITGMIFIAVCLVVPGVILIVNR